MLPPKEMLSEEQIANLRCPVTKRSGIIYGEKETMDAWSLGWLLVDASGGETFYSLTVAKGAITPGVYVDDGKAEGRRSWVLISLADISKHVEIECSRLFTHFLGDRSKKLRNGSLIFRIYQQSAYVRMISDNFEKDAGHVVKKANTPCLFYKDALLQLGGEEVPAVFRDTARTHLGAVLYVARSTRPDVSEAVGGINGLAS